MQTNVKIESNGIIYSLYSEVADTDEARAKGLMGRYDLQENEAMLFVYAEDVIPNFWMKNMKIPIDIIFIGSDKKIKYIEKSAPPCLPNEPCTYYNPQDFVRYVLEVKAGFCESRNIDIGDLVKF